MHNFCCFIMITLLKYLESMNYIKTNKVQSSQNKLLFPIIIIFFHLYICFFCYHFQLYDYNKNFQMIIIELNLFAQNLATKILFYSIWERQLILQWLYVNNKIYLELNQLENNTLCQKQQTHFISCSIVMFCPIVLDVTRKKYQRN